MTETKNCLDCIYADHFKPRVDEIERQLAIGCKKPGYEGYVTPDHPACGGVHYESRHKGLNMKAYHYSFAPTGVIEIDRILSAVASAGRSYHDTYDWNEEYDYGANKGMSPVDLIQEAANNAAKFIKEKA